MSNQTAERTKRHKRFFISEHFDFRDEEQVTQLKKLFEAAGTAKVLHMSKGTTEGPEDIRRFVGTIHVWERF